MVATYLFQRTDGSSVCLSTAPLVENSTGFTSVESDILPSGFLVYPGAKPAATIAEAIGIASKIPQGHRIKQ